MYLNVRYGLYSLFLIFVTAVICSYLVNTGLEGFYKILNKPLQTPDNHYFRYIWMALYIFLFLGFYIALLANKTLEQSLDLHALFCLQLFLQILWCFSFFYMYQIGVSAIVIVMLDMVVALLMHTLFFINLWSFCFFIPYLLWLLFATYLNVFLVFLN